MPRKQMFVSQSTSDEVDTWEEQIEGRTFVFRIIHTSVLGQMPYYTASVHDKDDPAVSIQNMFVNRPTREQVGQALTDCDEFDEKFGLV
ncbi:MAG TPA: hypothetical protein VFC63_16760 [Blastocatellia bacterium]|nr:hypothetical protein [Blastocatellia bacterium]